MALKWPSYRCAMRGRVQQRRDATALRRAVGGRACNRSNFQRIKLPEITLVDEPPAAVWLEAGGGCQFDPGRLHFHAKAG
jgi:hypothetical protein